MRERNDGYIQAFQLRACCPLLGRGGWGEVIKYTDREYSEKYHYLIRPQKNPPPQKIFFLLFFFFSFSFLFFSFSRNEKYIFVGG